jgi:hypothetical protein
LQAGLRDAMTAVGSEVRQAYTDRTVACVPPTAPAAAKSISVNAAGDTITFYVPVKTTDANFVASSTAITMGFINEDANANGKLDSGEDKNNNKVLDRRLMRTQNGQSVAVGSANCLSGVLFQMRKNQSANNNTLTSLYIRLQGSISYGAKGILVREQLESIIDLQN